MELRSLKRLLSRKPRVTITQQFGSTLTLPVTSRLVIGSLPDNDVVLIDKSAALTEFEVSRTGKHVQIRAIVTGQSAVLTHDDPLTFAGYTFSLTDSFPRQTSFLLGLLTGLLVTSLSQGMLPPPLPNHSPELNQRPAIDYAEHHCHVLFIRLWNMCETYVESPILEHTEAIHSLATLLRLHIRREVLLTHRLSTSISPEVKKTIRSLHLFDQFKHDANLEKALRPVLNLAQEAWIYAE